jgi:hypothetical protein
MTMQTLGGDGAANGAGPRPGSTDALVDAAMDALDDFGPSPAAREKPENDNARKQPARKREADPAGDERDDGEEQPFADPEHEEEEGEEPDAAEEGAEEEEHDSRGSKEEPFTVKDLPKDKYIELKVDGEKVTVSFDEMASGYIREQTFTRRVNKTKMLADEAQSMVQKARDTQERVRSELRTFLSDPDEIYNFFLASDDREQVFEAAARKYAELRRAHRERPDERLAFQRRRDQERLQAEREHWEAEKRAEVEARTHQEQLARAREVFQPGWEAGLRKAGFPQPTQALYDEVMIRCNQQHARGEVVTTDNIADFVQRAAKLLELPPRGGKKRPAPAPVAEPRREAPSGAKKRGDPWAGKSQREKTRDPDFFLRNLKMRDLRR